MRNWIFSRNCYKCNPTLYFIVGTFEFMLCMRLYMLRLITNCSLAKKGIVVVGFLVFWFKDLNEYNLSLKDKLNNSAMRDFLILSRRHECECIIKWRKWSFIDWL